MPRATSGILHNAYFPTRIHSGIGEMTPPPPFPLNPPPSRENGGFLICKVMVAFSLLFFVENKECLQKN